MAEGDNGGTPPAGAVNPPSHPAFAGHPAASGTSLVQITAEEFQRLTGLKGELESFRVKHATDLSAKEVERLRAIAEKDGAEKALEEQRKSWQAKHDELQTSVDKVRGLYHGKAKSEALGAPLAGVEFAGDKPEIKAVAAAQFRSLVEPRFETYEDTQGNLIVREKGTGRPAADVMRELLNAPEYQHFFTPKSRGGAGTDGTRSASDSQQTNPAENPHPMGTKDWYIWKATHASQGADSRWRKPTQ